MTFRPLCQLEQLTYFSKIPWKIPKLYVFIICIIHVCIVQRVILLDFRCTILGVLNMVRGVLFSQLLLTPPDTSDRPPPATNPYQPIPTHTNPIVYPPNVYVYPPNVFYVENYKIYRDFSNILQEFIYNYFYPTNLSLDWKLIVGANPVLSTHPTK